MYSLLIALITTCPLIFSSCGTKYSNTDLPCPQEDIIVSDFKVAGMTCESCKISLQAELHAKSKIIEAEIDPALPPTQINIKVTHCKSLSRDTIKNIITKNNKFTVND